MKPRARSLTRFASWFFNTSPEWVAPKGGESTAAEPQQTERPTQQAPPTSEDAPARDVPPGPNQRPR